MLISTEVLGLSVCVCVCVLERVVIVLEWSPPPPPPNIYYSPAFFQALTACLMHSCTKDRHTKSQHTQNKKTLILSLSTNQVGHIRTPIHTQTQSIHFAALLFHKPKMCDKTGENSSWGTRHICRQCCLHTWILHISYIIYMHIA